MAALNVIRPPEKPRLRSHPNTEPGKADILDYFDEMHFLNNRAIDMLRVLHCALLEAASDTVPTVSFSSHHLTGLARCAEIGIEAITELEREFDTILPAIRDVGEAA